MTFYEEHEHDLYFDVYDSLKPLDEIEISDSQTGESAVWQAPAVRLHLAADDLLAALEAQTAAAQAVIDAWDSGDLPGAVRALAACIPAARDAIACARPPAG